jgi:prolipoprotein diacylglyceryltransferase
MLPYYQQPVLAVGPLRIHWFALLGVAAVLTGRSILLRRARRFGIDREEMAPLYLSMLLGGIAGAVLAGFASIGAIAGGAAGATLWCGLRRWPIARAIQGADIVAFATPFAGAIGRMGCTLAHDHRGLPSRAWFAFRFPEGGRYDLGFIDFVFLSVLCVVFVVLDRKPRAAGFFIGVAACSYGAFRLWRGTLEASPQFVPWMLVCLFGTALLGWRSYAAGAAASAHTPLRSVARGRVPIS